MRCLLHAPAVIVLTVSLLGQQPVQSPDKTREHPPAASCIVSGRVVAADDGSPLKSAVIVLSLYHSLPQRQSYTIASDSDGRFSIKDVPPGVYGFIASREGFVDQEYQENGNGGGAVLSLTAADRISDVLFRMTRTAVVAGRVTNEDGEAISDVNVVALRGPSPEEIDDDPSAAKRLSTVAGAMTDDRGQYRIFGLKPGEYYVRAIDSIEPNGSLPIPQSFWYLRNLGSAYAPVYYPGVLQANQAQAVSVRAGEEGQADVSMQRIKTVQVAGHVIGPNGPARNTWVQLQQIGGDDSSVNRDSPTDEKGNFRLKGIPPGSYLITADQQIVEDTVSEMHGRQKIEVGSENIDSVIVTLGGVNIQGHLTILRAGTPAFDRFGVALFATDEGEQIGEHGRVKKDGTFEIASLSNGNYALRVWGIGSDWYVKSARFGPEDILEKGLQIEGSMAGRLEVVISFETAQLEGSADTGDGPAIGAHVRVVPEPETAYNRSLLRTVSTDQTGHFSLTGLAPGTYRVLARCTNASTGGILRSEPQIITLSEHEHKTVQLTIKP
jgi:protocatechuate 3,4-dioxygenase beta subunit